MFLSKWRDHWDLDADPFVCEDADKDLVLGKVELGAVHSGFDRLFGDPRAPSPGIVFGEKGSGKSGLRLMMRRRLEEYNAAHSDDRVLAVEYTDFNAYIDEVRRSVGARGGATARDVIGNWEIADHLDAILALATSRLVDRVLSGDDQAPDLTRKQKLDLLLLTALYYRSPTRTVADAIKQLRYRLGGRVTGRPVRTTWGTLITVLGLGWAALPHVPPPLPVLADLAESLPGSPWWHTAAGLLVAASPWLVKFGESQLVRLRARRAVRSVRVLPGDPGPLAQILAGIPARDRREFVLPTDEADAPRYRLLARLVSLLKAYDYSSLWVLMDRVDEPTLLADSQEWMTEFVARILDMKLLQHPDIALKLFLPIEMESLWHSASPDQLRRMRLDKSNLIPELKWTGRELFEIADQRFEACLTEGAQRSLADLFDEDLPLPYVLETLHSLGTPRYAFGFLSEVFVQYVKDLPNDLPAADRRWKLPRAHFDVVRAGWIDRAGFLRRTLN